MSDTTRLCLVLACLLSGAAPGQALAARDQPRIEVRIEGVEDELRANVLGYLSTWLYRDTPGLSEAGVQRLHARAGDEVREALQPFGRYAATVDASLTSTPRGWLAVYRIDPGPEVRISSVTLELSGPGAQDPAFADARARLPLVIGEGLRHARYEEAKRRLQELAEDHGYLDARFTESVLAVDPAALSAAVRLGFATGRQFRFGELHIEQDFLDPELVRRFATFAPGDVFSVSALLELQYALNDSDYFASVHIEPQREAVDDAGRIPVRVTLTPRPAHRYSTGFGFGTDTGPRLTLGFEDRRLSRAGQRLATELRWSEVKQEIDARLSLPLARPASERLSLQANLAREDLGSTVSRKLELGAALTKQLDRWLQTAYLRYKAETSQFPNLPDETTQLVVPGVTWSLTVRDEPVYPTRGHRLLADLHASHDDIGSDATFAQYRLAAKLIRPLGERSRVIVRGELGGTWVDRLSDLPVSERFFTGGDLTLRGYGYNELGPTDAFGDVVGGRHLLVGSLEVEHMFGRKLGGALFVDAGNAADSLSDLTLRRALGIGLRWRSPVGMVRLDFARPQSDPAAGSWRIHVSIGPDL